jgi:chromosome segregation ATPase
LVVFKGSRVASAAKLCEAARAADLAMEAANAKAAQLDARANASVGNASEAHVRGLRGMADAIRANTDGVAECRKKIGDLTKSDEQQKAALETLQKKVKELESRMEATESDVDELAKPKGPTG